MELSDLRPGKRERTRRFKILLHRYTRETWRETERFGGDALQHLLHVETPGFQE